MKGKSMLISAGITVALAVLATGAAIFRPGQVHPQGAEWARVCRFRGYEGWQTISISHNGELLAVILGNPAMIDARKAGVPGNGKPFPDGAKMAKIHWNAKKNEATPGQPLVAGTLHDVDFMVKDSKRFADSGGWGYGEFEYDARVRYVQARHRGGHAAAGERRQVRVRVPHDSEEAGLRFTEYPKRVTLS